MQLKLFESEFNEPEPENEKNKKEIPSYIKFYSVLQYDRNKFKKLLDSATKEDFTYEEFKECCKSLIRKSYILDEFGKPKRDSDEPSIFRNSAMQNVYSRLYCFSGISPFVQSSIINIDGLVCHVDEKQAEIVDTWKLPLRKRLRLHIKVLKNLINGFEIKKAIERARFEKLYN